MMRARSGRIRAAVVAGLFAVLMFYTRMNHLLLPAFLLAFLLPSHVSSRIGDIRQALLRVRPAVVVAYLSVIAAGIALFALHTWWYTGHFSVIYGTSFGLQRTGLTPSTILSSAVWTNIGEALVAQVFMREPAAFDIRAVLVAAGAVASTLALLQLPGFSTLPASLAIMTFGTLAGSFLAHTHEYPGRMSIHVVPFAVAIAVCGFALVVDPHTHRSAERELERPLPGTDRSFGLSVGAVLLAIAGLLLWRHHPARAAVAASFGGLLMVAGAVAPAALKWPRIWWWRVTLAIGGFNARVLLTIIFAVLFVPLGLFWRLTGKDPLVRRRGAAGWMPYPARYRDPHHYQRMF
jgi:hypothetical protein